jgi:glycosyltransferase involved in cell wall biosynthesis
VEALRHKSETFWRWLPTAYERIEIAAVRRADRTIVMSEAAAARLARHSPTVEFGSNWFDETLFYPNGAGRQGSQLRIAWFGRLEPPKDPLLAIAVLEQLAARGISFSAWFAGTGSLVNMVENAIAQAGLREQVRLLGLLSRAELAAELRNSSVCLMTSLWEGFPRSAVEALACGVPIVSTDVGEMRALLAPATNGFVAATREPEELAERLVAADALDDAERIAASVGHLEATTKVGDLLESLRPLAASAARAP